MMKTYSSTGKWILGGEHSVLRGSRALVFPLPSMKLSFVYEESSMDLLAFFHGSTGDHYQLLFYGLVDRALDLLGIQRKLLKGSIRLESNLPLGNGLGASAALCVAVGTWLSDLGFVGQNKLESFCRELENIFHGESSGVDVAVVLSGRPLCFSRFAPTEFLDIQWKPHLYLSWSGQQGLTHNCVEQVKEFIQKEPLLGHQLDEQMSLAVESMKQLLTQPQLDLKESLKKLTQDMNSAKLCFETWKLAEGAVDREMKALMEAGALAVKPTGSGGGGYVLSLWENEPPAKVRSNLVSCW